MKKIRKIRFLDLWLDLFCYYQEVIGWEYRVFEDVKRLTGKIGSEMTHNEQVYSPQQAET